MSGGHKKIANNVLVKLSKVNRLIVFEIFQSLVAPIPVLVFLYSYMANVLVKGELLSRTKDKNYYERAKSIPSSLFIRHSLLWTHRSIMFLH